LRRKDFSSDAPGQLIRSLQGGYWTYQPNPLPPPEKARALGLALARELEDARGAIGELVGVGQMLPNPHLLIRPFIQREAVSSRPVPGPRSLVVSGFVALVARVSSHFTRFISLQMWLEPCNAMK
jgi:Fic/DOC family N-terminal